MHVRQARGLTVAIAMIAACGLAASAGRGTAQCDPACWSSPAPVPARLRRHCGNGHLDTYAESCERTQCGGCGTRPTSSIECVEREELCDGPAVSATCTELQFAGGTMRCARDCEAFDTRGCEPCFASARVTCGAFALSGLVDVGALAIAPSDLGIGVLFSAHRGARVPEDGWTDLATLFVAVLAPDLSVRAAPTEVIRTDFGGTIVPTRRLPRRHERRHALTRVLRPSPIGRGKAGRRRGDRHDGRPRDHVRGRHARDAARGRELSGRDARRARCSHELARWPRARARARRSHRRRAARCGRARDGRAMGRRHDDPGRPRHDARRGSSRRARWPAARRPERGRGAALPRRLACRWLPRRLGQRCAVRPRPRARPRAARWRPPHADGDASTLDDIVTDAHGATLLHVTGGASTAAPSIPVFGGLGVEVHPYASLGPDTIGLALHATRLERGIDPGLTGLRILVARITP